MSKNLYLFFILTLVGHGCSVFSTSPGELCDETDPACSSARKGANPVIPARVGNLPEDSSDKVDSENTEDDADDGTGDEIETDGQAGPGECVEGDDFCEGETPITCVENVFVTGTPCADGTYCLQGTCYSVGEECVPGESVGCFNETTMQVCDASGKSYEPGPCPEGEFCLDGQCGDQLCYPGSKTCVSITTPGTCNEKGDAFIPGEACPDNGACVDGQCKSGCSGLVKYGTSYIGCEYWSVDLDQYDDPMGDPKNAPYGVVISNPGSDTATITFEMGNGDTFEPVDPTVPGGSAKQFILPTLNDDGTGISKKSVRILGDRPITVHQFNPLDNLSQVASNDASLLLPANVLGTDYYVLTWPTTPIGAVGILPEGELFGDCCTDSDCAGGEVCCEFFGISTSCEESCSFPQTPSTCTEEGSGQGGLENQHGYFTVVAASAGTTTVTIDVTADVLAGPGVEEMPAGSTQTFGLEQFDVLTLQAAPIGGHPLHADR